MGCGTGDLTEVPHLLEPHQESAEALTDPLPTSTSIRVAMLRALPLRRSGTCAATPVYFPLPSDE